MSTRMHIATALTTAIIFSSGTSYAYQMNDSLKDGDAHAGNPVGGQYTADGWLVTAAQDRMWFEIPTLAEGAIEFTVKGITIDNLIVDDNEIFSMYEAGYGMSEPMAYMPYYRSNDYKCMLRIYGSIEPDRVGMQKLMWGICPGGAPGYHDTCPCASSVFDEPFGGDRNWDGSPQVLRFEWGGGHARYLRNGAVVHDIDWSGAGVSFGPSQPHFSLGSPRLAAVDTSSMPIGAVFYDVKVTGVEGGVATCEGVADAGSPDSGGTDAGGQAGLAAIIEDSSVYRYEPDTTPADESSLDVGGDGQGVSDEAFYLKFDVQPPAGFRPSGARIWLYCGSLSTPGSAEGGGGSIYAVAENGWHETTITWNNRPAASAQAISALGHVATDTWYSFDVGAAVSARGIYSFAVVSLDSNSAHYLSKEGGGPSGKQPNMEFTYVPDDQLDGGAYDAGVIDDGGESDAGVQGDAGPAGDSGGNSDAAVTPDAGKVKDGGPSADTGAPVGGDGGGHADAGAFSYDTLGCGCSTLRIE